LAFCLTETGLVRPQIGEAFAFDAFQRLDPALFVVDLAIVIAEIKLSQTLPSLALMRPAKSLNGWLRRSCPQNGHKSLEAKLWAVSQFQLRWSMLNQRHGEIAYGELE
jgi:hypothetical protein